MLVIHLKRFEYDYTTMNRWKIKDRHAFLPESVEGYILQTGLLQDNTGHLFPNMMT